MRSYQILKTHWQATARFVKTDVINPEFKITGRNELYGFAARCRFMLTTTFQLIISKIFLNSNPKQYNY
jgi:hypothetical protein